MLNGCKFDIRKTIVAITHIGFVVYILPSLYSDNINCVVYYLLTFTVYVVIMLVKDI